jgi:hypothetical protein
MGRWLTWEPSHPRIMANPPATEPAKPPKPDFAGFEGALSGANPIIGGPETPPASVPSDAQNRRKSVTLGDTQNSGESAMPLMADSPGIRGAKSIKTPGGVPLHPAGRRQIASVRAEDPARGGHGLLCG